MLQEADSATTLTLTDNHIDSSPEASGDFLATVWHTLRRNLSSEAIHSTVSEYGPLLLQSLAVFFLGRMAAGVLSRTIVTACRKARIDETLGRFLANVVYALALTASCIAALSCLGINTTSLSAVLAAVGFAIGMALQGSLGNVASGVMLVFLKPFRVGDMIDVGGILGKVAEVQIFNTILLTPDNIRIILPNASVTGGVIRNLTAEKTRRIDLLISCSYNDDLRAVRAFLEGLMQDDPRILAEPAPVVAVAELAESGVNFAVRPWVTGADYHVVRFALMEKIKLGFDDRGFTIPFPSRDVFIHHPGNGLSVTEYVEAAAA